MLFMCFILSVCNPALGILYVLENRGWGSLWMWHFCWQWTGWQMTEAIITKYLLAKHISLTCFCDKGEIVKKSRNNRGPSVEPCGIPMFIDDGIERWLFTHMFFIRMPRIAHPLRIQMMISWLMYVSPLKFHWLLVFAIFRYFVVLLFKGSSI